MAVSLLAGALAGGAAGYLAAKGASGEAPLPALRSAPVGSPLPAPSPGSVAAIVEAIRPAVVNVSTESVARDFFLQPVPAKGAGSGFVVDAKGYVVTNSHVVADAREIEVVLADGRAVRADVVGEDPETDIAVLKIEAEGLMAAPLGDSSTLRVGDEVIAVGNALGLRGGPTVTVGIVSALGRSIASPAGTQIKHLLQTDAAINPGNSGGPLLDAAGRVVGINTAVAGGAENIGFAIAINPAKSIVEQLLRGGRVVRPFLGVGLSDVTPAVAASQNLSVREGALVVEVRKGGPGDQAGLRAGDVIVEIGGKKVADSDAAVDAIQAGRPGSPLDLAVVRGDDRLEMRAVLTEKN